MPRPRHNVVTYVGIDPGASGGIAVIGPSGSVRAWSMPETERDIWDLFNDLPMDCVGVIEKVWGHVGGPGQPGSRMFEFGCSYGELRMALAASGTVYEAVPPNTWQRAMSLPPRKKTGDAGADKRDYKNTLKAAAQRLFPKVKVTLKTADALLIAEFCRRKHEGRL